MSIKKLSILSILLVISLIWVTPAFSEDQQQEEEAPPLTNKLLYMYDLFYLPFSIEFREGRTPNDILPYVKDHNGDLRLIKAEELQKLDSEWNAIKEPWKVKSLLLSTQVAVNQSTRITSHLVSHKISIARSAFDNLSIGERIQLSELLKDKPPELQAAFKQLTFLKSLLGPSDTNRFNIFIFSASWCDSCKEYRTLFESYLKAYPDSDIVLHSVMINDPKEEIFEKPLLKELFPNPKKYSHESVPRFLTYENIQGKTRVLEEGDALQAFYDKLKSHRGFLDSKATLFKKNGPSSGFRGLTSLAN